VKVGKWENGSFVGLFDRFARSWQGVRIFLSLAGWNIQFFVHFQHRSLAHRRRER
jgi:hypothetical protein